MEIRLDDLFDADSPEWPAGSRERDRELFERAFGDRFEHVLRRLALGFSVLVYLPGGCMPAAAALVRRRVNRFDWSEYNGDLSAATGIEELLTGSKGLAAQLSRWLAGEQATPPAAILHNLELASDGRGAVLQSTGARTLLAALLDGTRRGVVLGLADRDAGPLPEALDRPFAERLLLDEIPMSRFHFLLPHKLGQKLAGNSHHIPAGAVWSIAARLRWTDPRRAFQILEAVAGRPDLAAVLEAVCADTRTVHFLDPASLDAVAEDPPGYPPGIVDRLQREVIAPFRQWVGFQGSVAELERALSRLPRGVILHGPPGTGKTRLAKWIAAKIGLPVRIASGSQLRFSGWGDAERAVRSLFNELRRAAPCILLLDDAEDLLPDRRTAEGNLAAAERAVVNECLQQLQGVHGSLDGVLVILTTNRAAALEKAAVDRLGIELRIPYPLTPDQIGEIVDAAAASLGYVLDPPVRTDLIGLFSTTHGGQIVADRSTAEDFLYSPREIENAMRRLWSWSGEEDLGALHRPPPSDVARLRNDGAAAPTAHGQKPT